MPIFQRWIMKTRIAEGADLKLGSGTNVLYSRLLS